MELLQKIDDYNALLRRKEELSELTAQNNKDIEAARRSLADEMIDADVEKIVRDGFSFTLSEKVQYSKKGGVDGELFDALREDGLGDIIKEKVDPRTLQAALKEMAERNDGELPEQYRDLISVYRYMDVGRRKA